MMTWVDFTQHRWHHEGKKDCREILKQNIETKICHHKIPELNLIEKLQAELKQLSEQKDSQSCLVKRNSTTVL